MKIPRWARWSAIAAAALLLLYLYPGLGVLFLPVYGVVFLVRWVRLGINHFLEEPGELRRWFPSLVFCRWMGRLGIAIIIGTAAVFLLWYDSGDPQWGLIIFLALAAFLPIYYGIGMSVLHFQLHSIVYGLHVRGHILRDPEACERVFREFDRCRRLHRLFCRFRGVDLAVMTEAVCPAEGS